MGTYINKEHLFVTWYIILFYFLLLLMDPHMSNSYKCNSKLEKLPDQLNKIQESYEKQQTTQNIVGDYRYNFTSNPPIIKYININIV